MPCITPTPEVEETAEEDEEVGQSGGDGGGDVEVEDALQPRPAGAHERVVVGRRVEEHRGHRRQHGERHGQAQGGRMPGWMVRAHGVLHSSMMKSNRIRASQVKTSANRASMAT